MVSLYLSLPLTRISDVTVSPHSKKEKKRDLYVTKKEEGLEGGGAGGTELFDSPWVYIHIYIYSFQVKDHVTGKSI